MAKPIMLAVHDQPPDLRVIRHELTSRYAAEYEIVCSDSPASALTRLEAARDTLGAEVLALFAASEMTAMTGVEFCGGRATCTLMRSGCCSSHSVTGRHRSRSSG
jgi:CheY-like chemotaxis protein